MKFSIMCQSDNNVQDSFMSSHLNDLTKCFNVDIILHYMYISDMDNARKLKFRSYVHLPSVQFQFNSKCVYCHKPFSYTSI